MIYNNNIFIVSCCTCALSRGASHRHGPSVAQFTQKSLCHRYRQRINPHPLLENSPSFQERFLTVSRHLFSLEIVHVKVVAFKWNTLGLASAWVHFSRGMTGHGSLLLSWSTWVSVEPFRFVFHPGSSFVRDQRTQIWSPSIGSRL
jgi:hypothetical protein